MSRVVVIGAGLGGLAIAARLAAGGHSVAICEQAPVVGGKLGRYEVLTSAGVFRFDTGPSLLTMPYVLAALFRETGQPLDSVLDLVRLDPVARYRFADGTELVACADHNEFCRRITATFGRSAADDWDRLWHRARRIWDITSGPFLEVPVTGATLARYALRLPDLASIAPWQTLRGLARSYLRDPRLRTLLERYATYTGSDPRRAPAALVAVAYAELTFGGWYVRGGLHRIATALLDRCTELGVTVHTNTAVSAIDVAGGRAAGVILSDGARMPADAVVSNADASQLYENLVTVPGQLTRLQSAPPSLSAFLLFIGLRGRTPNLAQHNVFFPADYDAEFESIFGASPTQPVDDPTLYVTRPDDATMRPDGHETWSVLVNAPRHGTGPDEFDWTARGVAEAYAAHLLTLLSRHGLQIDGRALFAHFRTPADLERETQAAGGAIYGTSSNGPRAAFLRPANRSPLPGLFLVGGSAHPGGGVPLVLLSAQIVAGLIGPP